MSVKFNVKITHKDIADFQLYHSRTHSAGIFGLVVTIVCLVAGVFCATQLMISEAMTLFLSAGILYFFPRYQLKAKAKFQAKKEMFQQELEYEFDETGFVTRQGDMEVPNEWEGVAKVVSTRRSILFYMTRVRVIIFPKKCIGEHYDEFVKIIRENMPNEKVKIR